MNSIMQDRKLDHLIHEMLARQNKLMIDRILPTLERLDRVDRKHQSELIQLRAAVKELTDEYFERIKAKQPGK